MTMTETNIALGEALRDSCMIVTLSIRQWTTLRTDRSLRDDIAEANAGDVAAFVGKKNLLAGADHAFKAIIATQTAFRKYLYNNTLPFGQTLGNQMRGPRIIANARFLEVMGKYAQAKKEMAEDLARAKATYAAAVETAKLRLGHAFKASDYPPAEALSGLFSIELEFMPMPAENGFRGLPQQVIETLEGHMERRLNAKADMARAEVKERVTALVDHFQNRVKAVQASFDEDYDGKQPKVYQSMLDQAEELAGVIDAYAPLLGTDGLDTARITRELRALAKTTPDTFRTPRGLAAVQTGTKALTDCFA
jgi:hypothetical protein